MSDERLVFQTRFGDLEMVRARLERVRHGIPPTWRATETSDAAHSPQRPPALQGFYPDVAPVTVAHILDVAKLGGFNTNHFFRVDKGFVAQARPARHRPAPSGSRSRKQLPATSSVPFRQLSSCSCFLEASALPNLPNAAAIVQPPRWRT